jgi:hypothetical protein
MEYSECDHCRGTGQEFPDCETCEGNGWVDDPSDGGTMNCPKCENERCQECDGTGETETESAS